MKRNSKLLAALLVVVLLGGQWAPAAGSPGPGSPAEVEPVARGASSVLDTVRHGLLTKAQQPAESPETVTVDRPAPEVPAVPPGPAPDPTTATPPAPDPDQATTGNIALPVGIIAAGVALTAAAASLGSRSEDRQEDPFPWFEHGAASQPDPERAESIQQDDDYRFINRWWAENHGEALSRISPYDLIGLSYAHSAGYRGEGTIITVMDNTFQVAPHNDHDHPVFADPGKVAGLFNDMPAAAPDHNLYHGTHVAGLAAGNSETMIGVAPDARLYLASFAGINNGDSRPERWGDSFLASLAIGARVDANSWGWDSAAMLDTRVVRELIDDPAAALAGWEGTEFEGWGEGFAGYAEENGFPLDNYKENPGLAVEAYFHFVYDGLDSSNPNQHYQQPAWDKLAADMHQFQTEGDGVIIWALENNRLQAPDGTYYADAPAAFPEIYPQLQGAWLTVANVNVFADGDSGETFALLQSSGCLQTARYCLAHNGTAVNSALPVDDYGALTGTSMAVPQVAGAMAILAQAFPEHGSEHLVNRVLATAGNFDDWQAIEQRGDRWFGLQTLPDGSTREVEFRVVDADSTAPQSPGEIDQMDFGHDITHAYSEIYGHGFVDLVAALQPVGELTVPIGREVEDASRLGLDDSRITLGPAFGDGLATGLAGRTLAALDGLDGAFQLPLEQFVQAADGRADGSEMLRHFGRAPDPHRMELGGGRLEVALSGAGNHRHAGPADREEGAAGVAELSFRRDIGADSGMRFAYNRHPGLDFGLSARGTIEPEWMLGRGAFVNPLLGLAAGGESLGLDLAMDRRATLRLGTFRGDQADHDLPADSAALIDHDHRDRARVRGAAAELALGFGPEGAPGGGLSLQAALLEEDNTLLGSRSGGAFDLADGTTSYTLGLTGELALGRWSGDTDLRLAGSVYTASSHPRAMETSFFQDVSSIESRAFSLGLLGRGLLAADDRWGLVLHRPLRVTGGHANLRLPVGHDGTTLRHDSVGVELTPSGRETRLEMFYGLDPAPGANLQGSIMLRHQPGHVRDAASEALALVRTNLKF